MSRQLQGPAVHVDSPDLGTGRTQREGDRDRTPAAPEVEQVAGRAGVGSPREKDPRARVQPTGGVDAAGGRQGEVATVQPDPDLLPLLG